jgi:hypothetical protein
MGFAQARQAASREGRADKIQTDKKVKKMHYNNARWWQCGVWLAVAALACAAQAATASSLALDIKGKITRTTDPDHTLYHLSEAQILALPPHSITTSTTWTPKSVFTGPLLADILKAAGAYGSEIEFHTYDEYTYTIPVSDAERYGVIVAYAMNGQRLELSDFGPLFLIYPRDAYPAELTGASADSKFVWQIKALVVK